MIAAFALGAVLWGAFAPQQAGSGPLQDPGQELRAQRLGKQLRCAVCQGMSISDSPASMARAQLDKVRELIAQGQGDEEIRDYFVARYGEWVLLEPKREGFALFVWLAPFGLIALGGLLIAWFVRSRSRLVPPPPPTPAAPEPTGDKYLDAVRAEVNR